MAKDFSGINTGRVYESIDQATSKRQQQAAASPEEAAQRKASMKTQGRKGCKGDRINMILTPENYDFIRVMSRLKGQTHTEFVNSVLEKCRLENPEVYQEAKNIIERAKL